MRIYIIGNDGITLCRKAPATVNDIDAQGWVSCWCRRSADGDRTHALFPNQSQSIPDNVVALFGRIRAWHCSAGRDRTIAGGLFAAQRV